MKINLMDMRKSIRIKGDFSLELRGGNKLKVGKAIDVSLHGLCCEANGKVPVFEEIEIRFQLPSSKYVLSCKGVLVRCEPAKTHGKFIMAFYFTDWEPHSKQKMKAFLKSKLLSEAA